jgi:MOSC domain-containing protein YiiM
MALALRLLSVNVAQPAVIGERDGEPLLSAIAKRAVAGETIALGRTNLAGDAQANLVKHGGPDKAVYAYPADNWTWWETEKQFACAPGAFGENLTLAGADETMVRIGDRFSWGDTVLEITQPRSPCHKLLIHTARPDASFIMTRSGRCGWYLRVIVPGTAPLRDALLVRIAEGTGATVRDAFLGAYDTRLGEAARRALADAPALSEAWRRKLLMAAQ